MSACVYLVECADGTYYIGYTTDVARRIAAHNAGDGAKYTRGRTPVALRYVEYWDSKSGAMSREWELKQYTRAEKEQLVPDSGDRVAVSFATASATPAADHRGDEGERGR